MAQEQDGIITVDRATLYAEVWTTPGRTLAGKYRVSDVALAKACRRHDIPRPARGHWSKLAAGKPVSQDPLPPLKNPALNQIRFFGGVAGTRGFHDPELEAMKDGQASRQVIAVPDRLSTPHVLVTSTRDHFRTVAKDRPNPAHSNGQVLAVSVSPGSLPRALRIMDTLIKAWESLAGTVSIGPNQRDATQTATYFCLGEDRVALALDEKQESIPDSNGRLSWRPEKRFTGQLTIRFDRAWFSNLRATWADGKRQRLENVLSSVITGLLERIDYEKRTRLDRQIEARQGKRAVERREAGQRRAAEEQNRRKRLKVEVARWHYAQRIRQYLATIEAGIAEGKLRARDPDAFAGWIEWANWYADDIDPLVDHEPLPEENCPPTNAQLADIELTSHTRPIIERLGVKDAEGLYSPTRDAVRAAEGDGRHGAWGEVCNVLEGLGYDVSGRRSWY